MAVVREKPCVDFCIYCRKETAYELRKIPFNHRIRGKDYSFMITGAICKECGEQMSIPGLLDRNVEEVKEQYRAAANLHDDGGGTQ